MALLNNAPMPAGDPMVYPPKHAQAELVTRPWLDWFNNIISNQSKASGEIAKVTLRDQTAAIATTAINTQPLTAGLYQILFYLRLSEVDPVSANIVLTFTFTWNGTARTIVSGTLGANTLTQTVGTPEPLIAVDANTQITYSTAVTWGVTGGKYAIDIILLEVSA